MFHLSSWLLTWRNIEFCQRLFLKFRGSIREYFDSIYVLHYIYLLAYFPMLNHPCIPVMKPT
jgi:hypothetical protein